jgi:hypothetical protein
MTECGWRSSVPPGTFKSDDEYFLLPALGLAYLLTERSTVGAALIGHGGMNTTCDNAVFERFAAPPGTPQNPTGEFTAGDPTGVDLAQLVMSFTSAFRVTPGPRGVVPLACLLLAFAAPVCAQDVDGKLRPYVLASQSGGDIQPQLEQVRATLTGRAGYLCYPSIYILGS